MTTTTSDGELWHQSQVLQHYYDKSKAGRQQQQQQQQSPQSPQSPLQSQQAQQQEDASTLEHKDDDTHTTKPSSSSSSSCSILQFFGTIHIVWMDTTRVLHQHIIRDTIVGLATHAARNPWFYILGMTTASMALLMGGLLTNFQYKDEELFTSLLAPYHSRTRQEWEWQQTLPSAASSSNDGDELWFGVHDATGQNILNVDSIHRIFDMIEVVRASTTPDTGISYDDVCFGSIIDPWTGQTSTTSRSSSSSSSSWMESHEKLKAQDRNNDENDDNINNEDDDFMAHYSCHIQSVTRFWNHNRTRFQEEVQDDWLKLQEAISRNVFPDGSFVDTATIMGNVERNTVNNQIISVEMFHTHISLSNRMRTSDIQDLQQVMLQDLLQQREAWLDDNYDAAPVENNNNDDDDDNDEDDSLMIPLTDDEDSSSIHVRVYAHVDDRRRQMTRSDDTTTSFRGGDSSDTPKRALANGSSSSDKEELVGSSIDDGIQYRLQVMIPKDSPSIEMRRALEQDLPLVALGIALFCLFPCGVFWKCQNPVLSRSLLAIGSIVTIGLSCTAGFGVLWIIGIPFTNFTMIVPFVVLAVGLNNTFIITSAFFRTNCCSHTTATRRRIESNSNTTNITDSYDNNWHFDHEDHHDTTMYDMCCGHSNNSHNINNDAIIVNKIQETMKDIGISLSMTTITTSLAFLLGGCIMSSIPAIVWLSWYAFGMILINLLYQITLFVALLVLDERRVQQHRMDILFCVKSPFVENGYSMDNNNTDSSNNNNNNVIPGDIVYATTESQQQEEEQQTMKQTPHYVVTTRFMANCADIILFQPWMKLMILVSFFLLFAISAYSTTKLRQQFKVTRLVPKDSYYKDAWKSLQAYSTNRKLDATIYFRNMNQSDPFVQTQMIQYIHDMTKLYSRNNNNNEKDDSTATLSSSILFGGGLPFGRDANPPFCWVRDFPFFMNDPAYKVLWDIRDNMTHLEKVDQLLSIPLIQEFYGSSIVRNATTGEIVVSKCTLFLQDDTFDLDNVHSQINMFHAQESVTAQQLLNYKQKDRSAFVYSDVFSLWNFFSIYTDELILTTFSATATVILVGFVFLPHFAAILFLIPIMFCLNIELAAVVQLAGLHMNVFTFVSLVLSIAFLVDYLMHVLLRYYQSKKLTRRDKVKDAMITMGSSILLGGATVFFGIIPLAVTTSYMIRTIYVCFLGTIMLGVSHGLILLPILLSIFGPVHSNSSTRTTTTALLQETSNRDTLDESLPATDNSQRRSDVNDNSNNHSYQDHTEGGTFSSLQDYIFDKYGSDDFFVADHHFHSTSSSSSVASSDDGERDHFTNDHDDISTCSAVANEINLSEF